MAFELKDGQGTMFVNDKKGNDKAPDRRGELNIGGVMYEIAGWVKQGQRGPWISISCKPKEERAAPPARTVAPDEDVPF
jgi:hypothetical protein